MTNRTTQVFEDTNALTAHVAEWLVGRIADSTGPFALALSGGSTPRPLYELLATPALAGRIDWPRVHLFWGDERFVPHDDPQSNYLMAKRALLDHVPIPAGNVHAIPTQGTQEDAARAYERTLQDFYGSARLDPARPLFGVNLLGMGDDGHTASLFPGAAQLDERDAWVLPSISPKEEPRRITLTLPALSSAATVAFLVAGAGKRAMVSRVFEQGSVLPSARIASVGQEIWFMDRAAAPV